MSERGDCDHALACGVRVLWIARFDYPRQRRLAAHRHRDYQQIFHILAGRAWFRIGQQEYHAPAGTTLRVPTDTVHAMRVLSRDPVRTLDCKFRVNDPALDAWLQSLPLTSDLAPERARDHLQRIRHSASSTHPHRQALCDSILSTLILEFCGQATVEQTPASERSNQGGPEALNDLGDDAVAGLRHWLEEHHAESIDGATIAAALGYSYRHLAGLCRAAFACTPMQLLQQVRVEVAQRLLLADDRSSGHILCRVGFASPAHGNRVFRRLCGVTPEVWRKQQREHIGRGTALDPDFIDRDWVRPN